MCSTVCRYPGHLPAPAKAPVGGEPDDGVPANGRDQHRIPEPLLPAEPGSPLAQGLQRLGPRHRGRRDQRVVEIPQRLGMSSSTASRMCNELGSKHAQDACSPRGPVSARRPRPAVAPSIVDCVQLPTPGSASEFVLPPRRELDTGPDHEVLDGQRRPGSRREQRGRRTAPRCGRTGRRDRSPRTSHSPVCSPARTSIPSAPDGSRRLPRCSGSHARVRRKLSHETVAGRLDLPIPKPSQLVTHSLVIRVQAHANAGRPVTPPAWSSRRCR